jgi:DNA-directed RNA polymerase specialized sigma24 family protein
MRLAYEQAEQGGVDGGDATPTVGEPSNASGTTFEAERDSGGTSVPLASDVLEAFKAQCNRELLVRVTRYARRLATGVADLGGGGGDALADDLVQEALLDTQKGVLRWDPAAASLELHLTSRIRSRTRDERRRAVAYPHVSLSTPAKEEDEGLSLLEEAEAALSLQQEAEARAQRVRRRGALKKLIAEDPAVRAIVNAVEDGAKTKADILRSAGLSAREYRNARDRLGYMKRQIAGGEDHDYSVAGGRSDQEERAGANKRRG